MTAAVYHRILPLGIGGSIVSAARPIFSFMLNSSIILCGLFSVQSKGKKSSTSSLALDNFTKVAVAKLLSFEKLL